MRAMMEQKDCFMASVSHELRTPLNGIIGLTEGLLKGTYGPLSDAMRRQLHIVRMSGLRLLSMINGIMDSSALRMKKLNIREEPVNVHATCDDVMELTRHLTKGPVAIVNAVPRGCVVRGDSDRLVQIFNNLLGNAAKFTKAGEIRVSAEREAGGAAWAVSVTDTGIGIPADKLGTIFDAFEQVRDSASVRACRWWGGRRWRVARAGAGARRLQYVRHAACTLDARAALPCMRAAPLSPHTHASSARGGTHGMGAAARTARSPPRAQVDTSIARNYGGFGLGLNIVRDLVRAHGGTVSVASTVDVGSTFTFTMPAAEGGGRGGRGGDRGGGRPRPRRPESRAALPRPDKAALVRAPPPLRLMLPAVGVACDLLVPSRLGAD